MKTLTTRNPAHPRNVRDEVRQKYKRDYRSCSNAKLDELLEALQMDLTGSRKQKLERLVEDGIRTWETQFEKLYGFKYNDSDGFKNYLTGRELENKYSPVEEDRKHNTNP